MRICIHASNTYAALLFTCWFAWIVRADLVDFNEPPPLPHPVVAPAPAGNEPIVVPVPAEKKETVPSPKPTAEGKTQSPGTTAGVKPEKAPVFFEGDLFNGLKKEGFVELEKNVQITQEDLKMTGDRAKVFFKPDGEEVERVEAYGNVVVTKKDPDTQELIHAYGNIAIYDIQTRLITLKENAKLRRGKDEFHGAYIEYNVDTGHIKAGKVQGTLTPEESDTKSNKKKPKP